jgi:hypothetical protein
MNTKSDRLKKFEGELKDLEDWLRLGLVPKKDLDNHRVEIKEAKVKIVDEEKRMKKLRESGDLEEYVSRKNVARPAPFSDSPTMPDLDIGGGGEDYVDLNIAHEVDNFEFDTSSIIEEKDTSDDTVLETKEEDNPFSEKNRWIRGVAEHSDEDAW